jgi:dihydroorotase
MIDNVYPWIDIHLHCRDEKLSYKGSTIKSTAELSAKYGGIAFVDMPNNNPPTISLTNVIRRFGIAADADCIERYYLNMGLTKDPKQIESAARAAKAIPKLNALKFFTTGREDDVLAIKKEADQNTVYSTLKECKYDGVVIVHCEDEAMFNMGKFKPEEPWTWNDQRPPAAEEHAVYKQIKLSEENGFGWHLHFPHVSSPGTFDIIEDAYERGLSVSGEVTPHHLLRSTDYMTGPDGLMLKTNPPVRKQKVIDELWEKLRNTKVPFTIGSDNAPHTDEEKMNPPYASGHQSIPLYPELLQQMRKRGFSENYIIKLANGNAREIFPKIKA